MINLNFNTGLSLKKIDKALSDIPHNSKSIMKTALNNSAKRVLKILNKQVKETYAVNSKTFNGKNHLTKIQKASNKKLYSTIKISSKNSNIYNFSTSYRQPTNSFSSASKPKDVLAKVLKSGRRKSLGRSTGKAFISKVGSKFTGVFVRKSSERYPLKTFYTPAISQLIGSYKVYGKLKPEMNTIISEELNKQVQKTLKKMAG